MDGDRLLMSTISGVLPVDGVLPQDLKRNGLNGWWLVKRWELSDMDGVQGEGEEEPVKLRTEFEMMKMVPLKILVPVMRMAVVSNLLLGEILAEVDDEPEVEAAQSCDLDQHDLRGVCAFHSLDDFLKGYVPI